MKSLLAAFIILCSFNAFSYTDNFDGDVTDIWLSWCDEGKVVTSSNLRLIIKDDCAAEKKVCVSDQRTRGKYVYYSARCEDKPEKMTRADLGSQ